METLPWSWYADPNVARLEQERIFRRAWQYVGRVDQVAEPGTYFTPTAGDVPIVVTRDRDGILRAFVNVCRHRGSVVARGEGRRETLQCAYHAWTYGLDGSLRAAPRSEREGGLDGSLGLVPVATDTWGPFVFINPDAEAAPLAETLGPLPELVAEAGIDVGRLRFFVRSEYELATNWKVACENFLECYHCSVAHPDLTRVIDVRPDAYRLEADGLVSSQFGPARGGSGPYDARGEVERGQFHFVWPNLKVNIYPGHPNLSIGPVLPAGPERSRGFLDYFFADGVAQEWIEELLAFDDQVGREDAVLVESVQRGVRSGVVERGRLLDSSEGLIAHFQSLVADALTA